MRSWWPLHSPKTGLGERRFAGLASLGWIVRVVRSTTPSISISISINRTRKVWLAEFSQHLGERHRCGNLRNDGTRHQCLLLELHAVGALTDMCNDYTTSVVYLIHNATAPKSSVVLWPVMEL